MKSLPSRRFSRFGVSRSAGRSASSSVADAGGGGADTTVSASQSTVTSSPSTIPNDGATTSTVTVTVRNASGTPLAGKAVTLSSTGSNNTVGQPSSVTDSNGETTGTIASTTAETKTITAVAEGITITDTAAVSVSTAIVPLFASSFTTGTGTSDAAKRDTSGITAPLVWTISSNTNSVIAATGLGFPARFTNVLSVPGSTAGINRVTGLGDQGNGTERYYRVFKRFDMPYPTSDNQTHPFQDGNAGSDCNWAIDFFNNTVLNYADCSETQYRMAVNFPATQAAWYENFYYGPLMDRGTVYCMEWMVSYTSEFAFNLDIRISDVDGVLLYDSSDFYDARGAAANRDLATRNGSGTFVAPATNGRTESNGFNAGSNDAAAEFDPFYGYQTGIVIADDQGWIGAAAVDGE